MRCFVGVVREGKYAEVDYRGSKGYLSKGQAGFLTLILCLWLSGFGLLSLAATSESLFLRSIVRTGFQFVPLTFEAVEMKDFLCVFVHGSLVQLAQSSNRPRCIERENSSSGRIIPICICTPLGGSFENSARLTALWYVGQIPNSKMRKQRSASATAFACSWSSSVPGLLGESGHESNSTPGITRSFPMLGST